MYVVFDPLNVLLHHQSSLNIDACTPPQSCLETNFTTPTPTPSHNTRDVRWITSTIARVDGFPGVPTPSLFRIFAAAVAQPGHTGPDFAYPMHFICYSLQWHLRKHTSNNWQFLLNDSTGDEQPRIWAHLSTIHKYIYNIDIYTKAAMIYLLSTPHIWF